MTRDDTGTGVDVILEHAATPDVTLALSRAFADFGIATRLRAAPRRRVVEGTAWRVVISVPLHELLVAFGTPRGVWPTTLSALVARISSAWTAGPDGHIEVGARGVDRRATGGVLLTPDLPDVAYERLVHLASRTLDPDRLILWDSDATDWRTFDVDVPVAVRSAAEGGADLAAEGTQGGFGRLD